MEQDSQDPVQPTTIEKYKDIDPTEKWLIAVLLGIVFLIVASPLVFSFSNAIFGYVGWNTVKENGKPSSFGWVLHLAAFIIIVRVLMA